MRMNSPEGKGILALVRGGAFAHAGETEAIEMALASIPKNDNRRVLDVGCGLGGTADYVAGHGWGRVSGIDIDAASIERAKENFPQCDFAVSDACEVGQLWGAIFDLIYCFNSFYAFPRQQAALAEMGQVAKPGARLVIFDYTDPENRYADSAFARRAESSFWQPLQPARLETLATATGWTLQTSRDISTDYLRWYENLIRRIESHQAKVVTIYGEEAFGFVHAFYSTLRDAVVQKVIGGGIFIFQWSASFGEEDE